VARRPWSAPAKASPGTSGGGTPAFAFVTSGLEDTKVRWYGTTGEAGHLCQGSGRGMGHPLQNIRS